MYDTSRLDEGFSHDVDGNGVDQIFGRWHATRLPEPTEYSVAGTEQVRYQLQVAVASMVASILLSVPSLVAVLCIIILLFIFCTIKCLTTSSCDRCITMAIIRFVRSLFSVFSLLWHV